MCKKIEDFFHQFIRNDKWGTCVECPRDSKGSAYPEFCKLYNRYDHQLTLDDLVGVYKNS